MIALTHMLAAWERDNADSFRVDVAHPDGTVTIRPVYSDGFGATVHGDNIAPSGTTLAQAADVIAGYVGEVYG